MEEVMAEHIIWESNIQGKVDEIPQREYVE